MSKIAQLYQHSPNEAVFLLPPAKQDLIQGDFMVGIGGRGDHTRTKIRALLDNAGHRITSCNVNYASLC